MHPSIASPSSSEQSRLEALKGLALLDTPAEERFDRITRIAAQVLSAPIACISLVDTDRVFIKSSCGLPLREIPRAGFFCSEAIAANDLFVVPDAGNDARFAQHALVVGEPHVRFYAGVPLITSDACIGTLCVMDCWPRKLSVTEVQALLDLAAMVEREISQSSAVQRYIEVAERERRRRRDLQLLLDHSPVVAFIKDEEGCLRYVNRQFEEMFGWALDEVRGKTDAAWAPVDVARQLAANDRAALNANEPHENLESVPIPGGGMRDWLVFRFPYVRESGERVLGGVAVDMTEQQEMHAALNRSEERYRTLFEGASDIVCSLGRDGRLLHANPAWKKTFGPTQTAAGAISIFDFIHRNSQEECEALLERARKGENALPWKAQFVALGGQVLHLEGSANCSYTDGTKLEVIRLILRNVSASDGEAREPSGDDRFIVAARHGTFLVYEWRIPSGEVHWHGDIDAALRCKSGAWPRTFDGRKQALHPEDRDRVLAEIDDHLSRRTPFVSEYRVICRDGSVRHWTERGEARRDGAGHPTLWVGAILDITPQKEAEAALITARDAAERAGKTKSHFLAILSHEVRTPVNSVLGVSGLLLEKDLSLEARPLVEMVQHSAEHLLAVVGDVLDYSKIEAGQLTLEAIDFDLGTVVKELVTVHGINARARRLSLEASIDRHAPRWVRGDPVRLRQVLGNLIDNAIKFSEVGRIYVRVAAETKEDGNTEVTFAVSDQGIGIPSDATLRIFEPFEQGDTQTSQRYGGVGLGLAICRQLVQLMGGKIWVESEVDKGSTFYFTVQLEPPTMRHDSVAADAQATQLTVPRRTPLRALVAEDNPVNRLILVHQLQHLGCAVDTVDHGAKAVALATTRTFDLVLMDCQMPVMDGYEATAAIRAAEAKSGRRTHIVATTAHAYSTDRERCLAAGMDDFIAKPCRMEALRAIVQNIDKTRTDGDATTEAPAVDVLLLAQLRREGGTDGGGEHFAQLVELFDQETRDALFMLEAKDSDTEAIRRFAHKLRGSAAHFGAQQLRAIAFEVENHAAAGDLKEALKHIPSVRQEVERVRAALAQECSWVAGIAEDSAEPESVEP